jgi:carboxylesterase type B
MFNGSGLVETQRVTVVTLDYRVNAFGFLGSRHPRDVDGSTGNFGC